MKREVPLPRFADQLLRSHLQVAGIGLLVVLSVMLSIPILFTTIRTMIYQWEPVNRVATQLLLNVRQAHTALNTWVLLNDDKAPQTWQHRWHDEITAQSEALRHRLEAMDNHQGVEMVIQLRPWLRKLYVSQWRVQDVALTLGNEPARAAFQHTLQPVAEELSGLLQTLAYERSKSPPCGSGNQGDPVTLLMVERHLHDAVETLDRFIGQGFPHQEFSVHQALRAMRDTFEAWDRAQRSQAQEEYGGSILMTQILQSFLALEQLSDALITLRKSEQWHVARFLIRTQTKPLMEQVVQRIRALLAHSQGVMDRHVRDAARLSFVTLVSALFLLVVMVVVAFLLSRRKARLFTTPVLALLQGAHAFTDGKLSHDIPVTTDNELAALTHAFNRMRASLHQSQQDLAQTNVTLEQRAQDLLNANRELRDFVYIVSHDLRSPLLSIYGFTEELQRDLKTLGTMIETPSDPADAAHRVALQELLHSRLPEDLAYIMASAKKMGRLVDAVLTLSRLGHTVFRWGPLDLTAVVRDNILALTHTIRHTGARVTVGPLPELVTDHDAVDQIMGNLLANALKFLDASRPGEIHIAGTRNENKKTVTLWVEDNGRGIAPEEIGRIFDVFQRAGKQDREGDGMGLAYVKTLVKRLGGGVTCTSTEACGSVFTVTLPLFPADAKPGASEEGREHA